VTGHNTIGSRIKINYPFHPLYGSEVKVLSKSHNRDEAILVNAASGFCKEIPSWMIKPESTTYHISDVPKISIRAIKNLVELLRSSIDDLPF
jgi:hypothetical protein